MSECELNRAEAGTWAAGTFFRAGARHLSSIAHVDGYSTNHRRPHIVQMDDFIHPRQVREIRAAARSDKSCRHRAESRTGIDRRFFRDDGAYWPGHFPSWN